MSFKLLPAILLILATQASLAGHKLPEDSLLLSESFPALKQCYHKIIKIEIERGVW